MGKWLRKSLACYLAFAMFLIGVAPRVHAGFSPSKVVGLSPAERDSDLQKVQRFLEMKIVRERLKEYGFTAEEIQSRLDQLSEPQLHQLALGVDDLQVGGDGLGIVVALVVIGLLAYLLYLLVQQKIVIK